MAELPKVALPLVRFKLPTMLELPITLVFPLTDNPVNNPKLVMFGCEAVVTVPAVVAVLTAPDTLEPCMLLKLPPSPTKAVAFTYPDTFTPLEVITKTLLVPEILTVALPFVANFILLVSLTNEVAVVATIPVNKLPLPMK